MTRFCGACGAQLNGSEAFCGKCGARTAPPDATAQQQPAPPIQPVQPVQPVQYVPVVPVQALPPAPPAKSSPILKIILVLVVLLLLGGLLAVGGLFYAAHWGSQKYHEFARQAATGTSSSESGNTSNSEGSVNTSNSMSSIQDDPCRFLTKEEVSQATGVTIVRVHPASSGCSYIAEGDPQAMMSKHLALNNGIAGMTDAPSSSSGPPQDVDVFSYSVVSGTMQTALLGKIVQNLGPPASPSMTGIGDQAVVVGGGMIMARKGDKTVQITYIRCPCSTDAVKPLAQKLVSAL